MQKLRYTFLLAEILGRRIYGHIMGADCGLIGFNRLVLLVTVQE